MVDRNNVGTRNNRKGQTPPATDDATSAASTAPVSTPPATAVDTSTPPATLSFDAAQHDAGLLSLAHALSIPRYKADEARWTRNNAAPREWTNKGQFVNVLDSTDDGESDRAIIVGVDEAGIVNVSRGLVPVELGGATDRAGNPIPPVPSAIGAPASMIQTAPGQGEKRIIASIDPAQYGVPVECRDRFARLIVALVYGSGVRCVSASTRTAALAGSSNQTAAQSRKDYDGSIQRALVDIAGASGAKSGSLMVARTWCGLNPVDGAPLVGIIPIIVAQVTEALAGGWTMTAKTQTALKSAQKAAPQNMQTIIAQVATMIEAAKVATATAAQTPPATVTDEAKSEAPATV